MQARVPDWFRPVYYASCRLSSAEKNYSVTEREALGMVFAVQKFHHYLLGNYFIFYVDHQALMYLINKVIIQGRLARWMLLLQEYDFKIIHKPGKNYVGADFLSRATPAGEEDSLQTELPDATLFRVEVNTDGAEIAKYLRSGDCQ